MQINEIRYKWEQSRAYVTLQAKGKACRMCTRKNIFKGEELIFMQRISYQKPRDEQTKSAYKEHTCWMPI